MFIAKSLGFAFGVLFLGFRFLPPSLRLAFFAISFIFFSGQVPYDNLTFSPEFSFVSLEFFSNFVLGFIPPLFLSLSVYASLLFSSWVACLASSHCQFRDCENDSLFLLLLVFYLSVFFSSDLAIQLLLPVEQPRALVDFQETSQLIFKYAFSLSLPIFTASLSLDLFLAFFEKSTSLKEVVEAQSFRIILIAISLSLLFVPYSKLNWPV